MNQRLNIYKMIFEVLQNQTFSHLVYRHKEMDPFSVKLFQIMIKQFEFLSFQWEQFTEKKVPLSAEILLNMIVAQKHFFSSIPDYANVNEVVELSKIVSKKHTKLINAIGKKIIQNNWIYPQNLNENQQLSIESSTPLWIVELLVRQYGYQKGKSLLLEHLNPASLDYYVPAKYRDKDFLNENKLIKQNHFYQSELNLLQSPAFKHGKILVQDRNSQLLVDSLPFENITSILDTCSGPGTKTVNLSFKYPQAHIVALEIHKHRGELVKEQIKRCHCDNVEVVIADATQYETNAQFDLVFCDVPCSGLGVLKRKPDIKRRLKSTDLDELEKIQTLILHNSALKVSMNGYLVYATCTLNKKENEKQVQKFLHTHPNFKLIEEETLFSDETKGDSFYRAIFGRISL